MRRKIGLRSLLSLVLGGLVLLTSLVTLGIVVGASSDAAFGDAIDRGRQAQAVLSERLAAELRNVERIALLADDMADDAMREGIGALSPIVATVQHEPARPAGWSVRERTLAYRPQGTATSVTIDRGRLAALMTGLMEEGVSAVLLADDRILARTSSGGRIDEVPDGSLQALFATPLDPDDVLDDAPTLRRVVRRGDEPAFLSSAPVELGGPAGSAGSAVVGSAVARSAGAGIGLHVGFATTPSTVGDALDQIGMATLVAAAFVALAVLVALLLARRVTWRITQLRDALHDIAALELDGAGTMPPTPARELEDIRQALATAIRSLRAFSLFVPRQLVLRLLAHGDGSLRLAEARDVTVLFTDIVGFTSLASSMSPEEVTTLLNNHFAMVTHLVEAEGGTIDKYMGDGVLAFWGAPEASSDHAARGLRATWAILAAHEASAAGFGLRLGLHSGPAIAGTVGTSTRLNYTVMGDTVNVASRLEQLGREIDPDGRCCALVSAQTLQDTQTLGDTRTLGDTSCEECERIGKTVLRGRTAPLDVYRLRGSGLSS